MAAFYYCYAVAFLLNALTTQITGETCSAGVNPISISQFTPLTIRKTCYLQIFANYTLPCSGTLTQWDYIAYVPIGSSLKTVVYMDIWRKMPLPNDNKLKLVGSTRVLPTKSDLTSFQSYILQPNEYISVEVGDMIGMHYGSSDIADESVPIPYLDQLDASEPSTTFLWPFSHPIIAQLGSAVTTTGNVVGYRRQPALRAYVASTSSQSDEILSDSFWPVLVRADPVNPVTVPLQNGVSDTTQAPTTMQAPTTTKAPVTPAATTPVSDPGPMVKNGAGSDTTQAPTPAPTPGNGDTTPASTYPAGQSSAPAGDGSANSSTAAPAAGGTPAAVQQSQTTTASSGTLGQVQTAVTNAVNTALSYAKGLLTFADYTVNGTPVWIIVTVVAAILGIIIIVLIVLLCYACCCRNKGVPSGASGNYYKPNQKRQQLPPNMIRTAEVQTDYSADFTVPVTQEKGTMTKRTLEPARSLQQQPAYMVAPLAPAPPPPINSGNKGGSKPFIEMIFNDGQQQMASNAASRYL